MKVVEFEKDGKTHQRIEMGDVMTVEETDKHIVKMLADAFEKIEMNDAKVRFKDLTFPVKLAVIAGWIVMSAWIIMFLAGFIDGAVGRSAAVGITV